MNKEDQEKLISLKENLDFSLLYEEPFNGKEKFIIVPVKSGYQPSYKKNSNPVTNLLLSMSDSGRITKGNIVQYVPVDIKNRIVPKGTFYKIYNDEKLGCDGRFTMFNLAGRPVYELNFKYGEVQSYGVAKREDQILPTTVPQDPISPDPVVVCIDWWLVTTTYYPDGSTEVTKEFLYTWCPTSSGGTSGGSGPSADSNNDIEYDYEEESFKFAKTTWENATIFGDWAFINIEVWTNAKFNNHNSQKNRFVQGVLKNLVFYHMSLGPNPTGWGNATEIVSFTINSNASATTHLKGYEKDPNGIKFNFDATKDWGLNDFTWR